MRHTFLGTAHLNKMAAGVPFEVPLLEQRPVASRKRKRIIQRLSIGLSRQKKRKFPFSRVKEALGALDMETIENQLSILEVHSIVIRPTNRTVELVRTFSERARLFMNDSCALTTDEIAAIEVNANQLTD